MKPAAARFRFDANKQSMQDLIRAVRAAGSKFDARLILQSLADDEKLTAALKSVDGVRSAGMQDHKGIRLVTFLMDHKTMYGDIESAAGSIGAKLTSPIFENQEAQH